MCNTIVHLQCIGIPTMKVDQILWNTHIKIICDNCLVQPFSPVLKRKNSSKFDSKNSINSSTSSQSQITTFLSPSQKNNKNIPSPDHNIQKNNNALHSIQKMVCENNKLLHTIQNSLKDSEQNIFEIKKITENTNLNAEKAQATTTSFADVLRKDLNSDNTKHQMFFRHRVASSQNNFTNITPKRNNNRKLTSGTDNSVDHDLGNGVVPKRNQNNQIHFNKSVYVSKLEPTVTNEKLMNFIKKKLPDLTDNDIKLHLLVKKDQKVEDLTFVSFRLLCNETFYEKFIDSSFWPSHVMIGEFIDKPRKTSSDFINISSSPSSQHKIKSPQNFLGQTISPSEKDQMEV